MTAPKCSIMTLVTTLLLIGFMGGCQSGPSGPNSRLEAYLGPPKDQANMSSSVSTLLPEEGVEAGLIVINDSSAPTSAPVLSQETFTHMRGLLRNRLMRELPMTIVKDLTPVQIPPQQNLSPFIKVAEQNGLDYVLVAVLSSEETSYPTYLPFNGIVQQGGGTGNNPGYETQNFALVELALLDVKESRLVRVADGQAWATLYTLDNQLKSNVYPVVVRAQQVNPIYPESYANAPDILRAVSADDAIKQALQHFKEAWGQQG